jgi:hypothetical protein
MSLTVYMVYIDRHVPIYMFKYVYVHIQVCRAYSPDTHARKDEDELILEFPCNPIRTRSV